MTHLVYPGALHTRFHHALGAMHLMGMAIETLKTKGHAITPDEEEAVTIAILLHDIGHGPYSHALEHTIVEGISHEHISELLMDNLNREFDNKLELALAIFKNKYHKHFLHQLVSGQMDIDRLDYLNRDSFFTGVSEGIIGFDRIIKMLDVADGELAIEVKGIYSVEKFLIARRLMYWQVYLHKTVVAAELMLVKILDRAKHLASNGKQLFATPNFSYFLNNSISRADFKENPRNLECFTLLDDYDIFTSVKVWASDDDFILSTLCKNLLSRNLYQVQITGEAADETVKSKLEAKVLDKYPITENEVSYFVFRDTIQNNAYRVGAENINILMKDGSVQDITLASDNSNLEALSKTVEKHILCYIKDIKHTAE